ncbi:MAG: CvpA family protein [Dehalococcoidia bacterium]
MNWLDILLFIVLILGTFYGYRKGLIKCIIMFGLGFALWHIVTNFGLSAVELLISEQINKFISSSSYYLSIFLALILVLIALKILSPIINTLTLGIPGLLNKLGGAFFGLLIGLVISSIIIVGISRLSYEFAPINELSETLNNSSHVPPDLLAHVNDTQEDIESTLTDSSITRILINSTPRFIVTFLPTEFEASLIVLQYKLEKSK